MFDLQDGEYLIKLARKSMETYIETGKEIEPPNDAPEKLTQKCGVFTSLHTLKGNLRGCIGYPEPIFPLIQATIGAAVNAATRDPRFPQVTSSELDNLLIEITILTPPEKIEVKDLKEYPNAIEVGKDGLIVKKGFFSGLLLPQVAVDWDWNEEQFLSQCCVKAGLSPDEWICDENVEISRFQAEVFEETKPKGQVVKRTLKQR
jgi:uncharacterized protein (TIGR00296 family)